MKRKFLFGFTCLAISTSVWASPVNFSKAQQVALNFMKTETGNRSVSLRLYELPSFSKGNQQPAFYVFTATQQHGFVIISGDDAVKPVLAYSTKNDFVGNKPISPEVNYWLNWYAEQVNYVQEHHLTATQAIQAEWTNWLQNITNNGSVAAKTTDVQPLLNTTWDQWPWYNDLCPTTPNSQNNPTGHAPTGCVATAMAQIMNYWQNPTTGTGSHSYNSSQLGGTLSADFGNTTYDWNNMPNELSSGSSSTEINAIATLMYHCGVAVNMDYTADESGAYVIDYGYTMPSAQEALPNYFGYSSNIQGLQRSSFTSDSNWISMLKFELDNGRPILYSGQGSFGGHAFDFDGYENAGDYFHVNWGWSGLSDGYFTIDNLAPSALGAGAGAGNFDQGQAALVMIEPSGSTLPQNPYIPQSSANFDLIYEGNGPQSPVSQIHDGDPYSVSATIENVGNGALSQSVYKLILVALDTTTENGYIVGQKLQNIASGQSYQYDFDTTALSTLNPGTYYMLFGYMAINNNQNYNFVTGQYGQYLAALLTVLPAQTGINDVKGNNAFLIYPNPADQQLTIKQATGNDPLQSVQLLDATGRKVYENTRPSGSTLSISTSSFASGIYYLELHTNEGNQKQKIFIRH